ncbi:MAG TPA: deoxyribodipyrimidine photo-lyase [Intrasporangium sp.]|uniref:cryptochrome/photolyase family protein n=1 Tax=Intrasporangium sp. TaxID=1925024 RepID=UPI002F95ACBB
MTVSLLWFRRDLRTCDHPALRAAVDAGTSVLPVFVLDPRLLAPDRPRSRRLVASVRALADSLDGRLVVRTGDPVEVIPGLAREVGAERVHVTRETTPFGRRRDAAVASALSTDGRRLITTGTPYAAEPGLVVTQSGEPYRVFTPFARAWRAHGSPPPVPPPRRVTWFDGDVGSVALPGGSAIGAHGDGAGELAARQKWIDFLADGRLGGYDRDRDRPDLDATSRMSIPLKYGEIHPRTLLADVASHPEGGTSGAATFVTELAWREFYADVLWHRPDSAWQDLRPELTDLAYDSAPESDRLVEAWREGRTGYPLVDAGMRQLLAEGWMHNRLRMVTASFLTKDLHVWWPIGARHFLDHLLDGDIASNNHGWQWVAGTGTDAAPYFRVFNPVRQARRFDPAGDYVRRWVPELAHVAGAAVHEPWLHGNGYVNGYPRRVVNHDDERREALARYELVRR